MCALTFPSSFLTPAAYALMAAAGSSSGPTVAQAIAHHTPVAARAAADSLALSNSSAPSSSSQSSYSSSPLPSPPSVASIHSSTKERLPYAEESVRVERAANRAILALTHPLASLLRANLQAEGTILSNALMLQEHIARHRFLDAILLAHRTRLTIDEWRVCVISPLT